MNNYDALNSRLKLIESENGIKIAKQLLRFSTMECVLMLLGQKYRSGKDDNNVFFPPLSFFIADFHSSDSDATKGVAWMKPIIT